MILHLHCEKEDCVVEGRGIVTGCTLLSITANKGRGGSYTYLETIFTTFIWDLKNISKEVMRDWLQEA